MKMKAGHDFAFSDTDICFDIRGKTFATKEAFNKGDSTLDI